MPTVHMLPMLLGFKLLMGLWLKAPLWHKIFCHDSEVMGSNSSQLELGVSSPV